MRTKAVEERGGRRIVHDENWVTGTPIPLEIIYPNRTRCKVHLEGVEMHRDALRGILAIVDGKASCRVPFTTRPSIYAWKKTETPWEQGTNSRSMCLLLNREGMETLVAKGVGTFNREAEEREKHSPFPIQVSRWFLTPFVSISYGQTLKYGIDAFNTAAAYKLECAKYGREANTLDPIALVFLETMPVHVAGDTYVELPTSKCIEWQLEGVSKEDRKRHWRTFRDAGASDLEVEWFFDHITPVPKPVAEKFYEFMAWETGLENRRAMLETWKPVVQIYVAEAANLRVGSATQKGQILEAHGIKAGEEGITAERRYWIAEKFAKKMAMVAFFHRAGGDFGGVDGELDARNVTVRGIIVDLETCKVPGKGADAKKQEQDRATAKETTAMFCRKLGLGEADAEKAVEGFDSEYRKNLMLKPNKNPSDF